MQTTIACAQFFSEAVVEHLGGAFSYLLKALNNKKKVTDKLARMQGVIFYLRDAIQFMQQRYVRAWLVGHYVFHGHERADVGCVFCDNDHADENNKASELTASSVCICNSQQNFIQALIKSTDNKEMLNATMNEMSLAVLVTLLKEHTNSIGKQLRWITRTLTCRGD